MDFFFVDQAYRRQELFLLGTDEGAYGPSYPGLPLALGGKIGTPGFF